MGTRHTKMAVFLAILTCLIDAPFFCVFSLSCTGNGFVFKALAAEFHLCGCRLTFLFVSFLICEWVFCCSILLIPTLCFFSPSFTMFNCFDLSSRSMCEWHTDTTLFGTQSAESYSLSCFQFQNIFICICVRACVNAFVWMLLLIELTFKNIPRARMFDKQQRIQQNLIWHFRSNSLKMRTWKREGKGRRWESIQMFGFYYICSQQSNCIQSHLKLKWSVGRKSETER